MLACWSVAQTDSNTEKNRGQKSPWTVPLKGKKSSQLIFNIMLSDHAKK